jgi:hypothetical protein
LSVYEAYLGIDASVPVEEDPRGLYYHKTDGKA